MGLVNHENIQDYWSTDEVLSTHFHPSKHAKRQIYEHFNIFSLVWQWSFIYLEDGQGITQSTSLALYSVHTEKFSSVWTPSKNICIDEGMILFRGKVHFNVYNPDKPDTCGVKSYQLCDSSNGCCCMFEINTGVNPDPPSAKGKTYNIVIRLMQPYLNVGRCLYVDNYYTSPTLFTDLNRLNTGTCGTARYRKKGRQISHE